MTNYFELTSYAVLLLQLLGGVSVLTGRLVVVSGITCDCSRGGCNRCLRLLVVVSAAKLLLSVVKESRLLLRYF